MIFARGLALLALLVWAIEAPAQVLTPWSPACGFGPTRIVHGRFLSIYLSGGYNLGYSPYAYCGPIGPRLNVVSVYAPPPLIVLPPPALPPEPWLGRWPMFPEDLPLPGEAAGNFRPRPPDNPPPPRQPVPPPEKPKAPAPQPKVPPPPPKKEEEVKPKPRPPRPPVELPPAPLPEFDPHDESARQVGLGKDALGGGEYGRAAQHFRLALVAVPGNPLACFLLGQALFALGKYGQAVDAVHTGLTLQPDWPNRHFRPLELYGDNVADYPEHLARLEDAVARHPDDPVLLFLYAYQLWFDGRQEEAAPLFERAARLASDRGDSERFLHARLPGVPMV